MGFLSYITLLSVCWLLAVASDCGQSEWRCRLPSQAKNMVTKQEASHGSSLTDPVVLEMKI